MFAGKDRRDALVEMEVVDGIARHVFCRTNRQVKDTKTDRYTRFSFEPMRKSDTRGLIIRFRLSPSESEGNLSLRYALGNPYLAGFVI